MIVFYLFQFDVFAYTVYPTVNNTFIYPLNQLGFENVYNCSANGWQIIESIQQSTTIIQDQIISITLGNLDNGFNQSYYAGVLTNNSVSIYQMVENGVFEKFQSVNYNRSIYNCSNMIFQNNSISLVIMCTQQQQISILFYQNQYLNLLNISSIQIDVGDLQQTNITQIENQIALSYIFTNYSTVYTLIQNNGIVTSIQQYKNYTGQFIQLFVSYNGVVFGMTQSEFLVNGILLTKSNTEFISLAAQYQDYQKTILLFALLEKNSIILLTCFFEQTLDDFQLSAINVQGQYQNLYLTKDYLILTNKTNIVTLKQSNFKQFYSPSFYNGFQNSFSLGYSNLILQSYSNTSLTLYQFNEAYLLNQQPQGTGNITINCYDANTNQKINNTIQYQALLFNDTGIYIQDNSIQSTNSSFYKLYVQKLSQYFVGPNITYQQNQMDCLYYAIDSYYLTNLIDTQIFSVLYFEFYNVYIEAFIDKGVLVLEYVQLDQKQDNIFFLAVEQTLNFTPIGIKIIKQIDIYVLLWTQNVLVLFSTTFLLQQINFQQTLNLSQVLNQSSIIIEQIQVIENIIYLLCSSPNQLLKITMNKTSLSTPTIMNQFCVYNSIETNVVSYPNMLFINCQNQLIILRNSFQDQGYSIVLTYHYPQSQQALIGPISEGIYFYFYNSTSSSLYFLNKFYLYTLQDGFKLKLQQVYTDLKLSPNLIYAYSNRFFYVLQDEYNQSFVSVFKGFFQQQNALLYSQYLEINITQIVTSVYQMGIVDLTAQVTSVANQTKLYFYYNDVTQAIVPIFNLSIQNNLTQILNISNSMNNFNFSQIIVFQQQFLQLSPIDQLQNQFTQNSSGYQKINVTDYFNGSIVNFSVNCTGCSNYSYLQPLQQQAVYNITKVTNTISINNFLYAFSGDNVLQIDLTNQNASAYQIISSISGYTCNTMFIEIFSQNPGWLCIESQSQQLIIFQFNQQNNQTVKFTLDMQISLYDTQYTDGFIQIYSQYESYEITSVIFYSFLNDVQSYQFINDSYIPNNRAGYTIPFKLQIDFTQFMQYFGSIYQLYSNQLMVVLFSVNISNNQVQSAQTSFYIVRDIDFQFVSTNDFYGQQLETIQDGLFSYANIGFATNLNPLIIQFVFYNYEFLYVKNLCQLNQVNFTSLQSEYFSITGLNNLVATQQSESNLIIVNLFDTSQCQNQQMIQSIGQIQIIQKVQEDQFINLVQQNLLTLGTYDNLFLFTVQSTLDLYYEFNQSELSFQITAQNQLTSAQQNLTITQNQTISPIHTNTHGLQWKWIITIIVVSLVIIILIIIVVLQKKKQSEDKNEEFEFTSGKIEKALI